jgi:hypothetical protein
MLSSSFRSLRDELSALDDEQVLAFSGFCYDVYMMQQ